MKQQLTNTAVPADPNAGPTITIHQQRANTVISAIDTLVAELPAVQPVQPGARIAHRAVPVPFMESIVTIADQYEEVRALSAIDTTTSTDRLQQFSAYRSALRRAEKFVQELTTVVDSIRSQLAVDSLDTYAGIKRLARRRGVNQPAFKALEKELRWKRKAKEPVDAAAAKTSGSATPSPGITPPIANTK